MTDAGAVARIERLVAHLRDGVPLPAADADALVAGLERYLAGKDPIDVELGLKPGSREAWRLEQRDQLIRAAAAEHLTHLDGHSARARAIHRALSAAWRVTADVAPPHLRGTLKGVCWSILRISRFIPKPRTIREILAEGEAFSPPTDDATQEVLEENWRHQNVR